MAGVGAKAALIRRLAELYPDDESVRRILDFAEIPKAFVRFGSRPIDTWFSAVSEANNRHRGADLLQVLLLEHPEDEILHLNFKTMIADKVVNFAPADSSTSVSVEKIMGKQSTLLPISFLDVGLQRARSVGRISAPGGMGTGFLLNGNLVVTNHHVISSPEESQRSAINFDFQAGPDGEMLPYRTVRFDPVAGFTTSKKHDLTIVRTTEDANERWGYVPLYEFDTRQTKRVNIIQHPGGGPKQIALYHNIVSHIDDAIVQYYTDTLPGSSGSPLFDDDWRLVGVHHAGGNLYSPSEKTWVYRNEGIAAGKLIELLSSLVSS